MITIYHKLFYQLRSLIFWGLDYINCANILKAYRLLTRFDSLDSSSEEISKYTNEALKKLFKHVAETTKFYEHLKADKFDLYSLPVVNKEIISRIQDEFISDLYKKDKLIKMATSGSTGTPFICYQNREKRKRVLAELIFYSGKVGYKIGSNIIFLRALTEKTKKSRLKQFVQNEALIDISYLSDSRIKMVLSKVEEVSSKYGSVLLANASTLDAIRDYLKNNDINIIKGAKIKGIISTGEMLFYKTRVFLSTAFSCNCVSRYSNQENGVIGQDEAGYLGRFILNEAHYYIEILELNSDLPVKNGKTGRIVITDLHNYAMPMIRYDTGDIGSIVYINRGGIMKRAITNFLGRNTDIVYDCNGNRLSPHLISNHFWSFPEITQYQFIQKSENEYKVIFKAEKNFNRRDELKALLSDLLGNWAIISIDQVKEIPSLPSGKRKYITNNMEQSK